MEMLATRDAYGHALCELGDRIDELVVLDADLSRSTRTEWFQQQHPEKFLNAGIAEQNLMGMAAGLALSSMLPFATTYAIFIGRAFDQIRNSICFASLNVKIVATHGGFSAAYDGGSHQAIEDLALMSCLPNMTVLSPADYHETRAAVLAAAAHDGPVYIRIGKYPVRSVTDPQRTFRVGAAYELRPGTDVAILATGALVAEALDATDVLAGHGISTRVINVPTIKPLDGAFVEAVLRDHPLVVTLEEHSVYGGLYSAVAALGARSGTACTVKPIGVDDVFGESGGWRELLEHYELTAEHVARKIHQWHGEVRSVQQTPC